MASAPRSHFADAHALLKTEYNSTSGHTCDICQSKLAGLVGYRCNACDFDIHEACADYFKETISFFAHPCHTLTLRRLPTTSWSCDLCREGCPQGHLVYRCLDCMFDVHPLCTLLPQNIRSPLHPQHDLRLVASGGTCKCGCKEWSVWNYVCSCSFKVNIACVSGAPRPSGGGQSNASTCTGSGDHVSSTTAQASSASQTTSSSGQSVAVKQSRRYSVAKFLLKTSFHVAINAATGGLASPVLEVLSAAFS